jgi:hypothetical protein
MFLENIGKGVVFNLGRRGKAELFRRAAMISLWRVQYSSRNVV